MKYSLANKSEAERAVEYLSELTEKKATVEIKRVVKKRTGQQNRYLHLLINAFGVHFGWRADEAKQIYKMVNADLYRYDRGGFTLWRSSADLDKEEMQKSIDRFREYSGEQGYELPLATQEDWIRSLENAIEINKHYL